MINKFYCNLITQLVTRLCTECAVLQTNMAYLNGSAIKCFLSVPKLHSYERYVNDMW